MFKILRVLGNLIDVIAADGQRRLKYAITNIIYMAFAVLCAWGAYKLVGLISDAAHNSVGGCTCDNANHVLGYAFAIFLCVAIGIYAFIAGVLTQAVLVVVTLLGTIFSSERGANFAAFLIGLISVGGMAVGILLLFGIL